MKASVGVWFLAVTFGLAETGHYGWNWTARSDAELICDGIVFLIVAIGGVCVAIERNGPSVTVNNHQHFEE